MVIFAHIFAFWRPENLRWWLGGIAIAVFLYRTGRDTGLWRWWRGRALHPAEPPPAVPAPADLSVPAPPPSPAPAYSRSPAPAPQSPQVPHQPAVTIPSQPQPPSSPQPRPRPPSPSGSVWMRARALPHSFIPDPANTMDATYLGLVHEAAAEGCVEALAKLGEYARRRNACIEAYHWTEKAKAVAIGRQTALPGGRGSAALLRALDRQLGAVKSQWLCSGCPPEVRNVYDRFTERDAAIARARISLACGVNVAEARQYLKRCSDSHHGFVLSVNC